jgi:hypothetical protein
MAKGRSHPSHVPEVLAPHGRFEILHEYVGKRFTCLRDEESHAIEPFRC